MPIFRTACMLVFAASTLVFTPRCLAIDVDPMVDRSAAQSAPTRSLFSSWFGSKTLKADASLGEAADADAEPSSSPTSFGSPRAGDLVVGALGLLGIAYRLGGNSPTSGFDCSGLVRYVFLNALGLDLPRRAEEISRVGARVDRDALKPGDLVFYRTLRKTFSHVGIYLGNNRFIHAPSAGGSVRVDDMNQSYWTTRFDGARRVGP